MARKQPLQPAHHLGTLQGDTLTCNLCGHHIETYMDQWHAPAEATGIVHTDHDTLEQMLEHLATTHPGREYGDWAQTRP